MFWHVVCRNRHGAYMRLDCKTGALNEAATYVTYPNLFHVINKKKSTFFHIKNIRIIAYDKIF